MCVAGQSSCGGCVWLAVVVVFGCMRKGSKSMRARAVRQVDRWRVECSQKYHDKYPDYNEAILRDKTISSNYHSSIYIVLYLRNTCIKAPPPSHPYILILLFGLFSLN